MNLIHEIKSYLQSASQFSRRWAAWCAVALSATLLMGACSFLSTPKTIHVNQSLIQTATNQKWDTISKTMKDNGLTATKPVIILMPDSQRIGAKFDAVVETGMLGTVLRGEMQMSGVPTYSPEMQAVVLKEFAVDSFNVSNIPSMFDGPARRIVQAMVGRKMGFDIPIYKLTTDQLSFAGKTWIPEKVQVEADRLTITLQPHDKAK